MSAPLLVTFKNTRAAIKAEKSLREAGLRLDVIPTPRHLSSECGMSLRIQGTEPSLVRHLLQERELGFTSLVEECL